MFQYFLGAIFWKIFNWNSPKRENYSKRKRTISLPKDGIIRFSFGKYRGQPVKKIWNSNRQYIDWLRENVDMTKYPNEEFMIELLFNAEA
ncbi:MULTISPECIES: exodeoxyribonuclease X C-terminal domain-containing protein [Tenacibaculum]